MSRIPVTLLILGLLTACGGGGGGGSSSSDPVPEPSPSEPEVQPTDITLLDSVPAADTPNVDPGHNRFNFTHLAQSDLEVSFNGDCDGLTGTTIRKRLVDLAETEFDEILDHYMTCTLAENSSYFIEANGTRSNDARFSATLAFDTGTQTQRGITVIDTLSVDRLAVEDLFRNYVEGALISELDLSSGVQSLIVDLVIDLAEANWGNLTDPDALYSVTSERVSYLSRTPDGSPSTELTGLVARPTVDLAPDFTKRGRVIVLTHATGSTPGDLNPADAWFILANLFASRGYLVIAPDNYGRGGTSDADETYLMANRTAYNALDLIHQVLDDTSYDDVYDGSDLSVIGYSQGGHSAMALWQLIEAQNIADLNIGEVYAGGAPHNLYQTFRGVLRHIDDSCDDETYCEFVDTETTVPFATDRILPGFFAYTDTALSLNDVVIGNAIDANFVTGFLNNEAAYDKLKSLLMLNSFTAIGNPEAFGSSASVVHLYHSRFDRLVPIENTEELASILSPHINLDLHQNRCNSDGYELIFNLTDKVGVLHTLCGLAVLNDAMGDLK
ncbi:MAG: alpha/beta fold hydrolase [Gammaproteobacteria bacterium]|mgnify:CR=1 FL=1|jgi:pimeloyl-ACP methyl ester carboxylesterase|nr:alpha/beta fold hydrolase [Gammaproteobacteria bacterium]MBT4491767.1 alpha/beta fold hydrolase [Gammaproteobacteria bacterium]MBT7371586.1 alpha/beta fold hydrolase [Gammaproteobacteria bacterium]